MGTYQKGDHVKIEVVNEESSESEWMWLLVDHSDDAQQLIFGQLDSEPIVANDMKRGQVLADFPLLETRRTKTKQRRK